MTDSGDSGDSDQDRKEEQDDIGHSGLSKHRGHVTEVVIGDAGPR